MAPVLTMAPALTLMLLAFAMSGCREQVSPSESTATPTETEGASQRPLKLVVVDDDELAAAAEREWTARASRRLQVLAISGTQFAEWSKADFRELADVDAVIVDSEWIGDLAEHNLIETMPDYVRTNRGFAGGDMAIEADILPLCRVSIMRWGDLYCGIPLAARPFVFGVRRDILQHLKLPVPHSVESVRDVVQAYALADKQAGWPELPLAQPLAPNWAVYDFLARAAPYCRHRNRFSALFDLRSMQPTIDGPDFVRALEELKESVETSSKSRAGLEMDPAESFRSLLMGDALMAVGWYGGLDGVPLSEEAMENIVITELPGSADVYSRSEESWQKRSDEDTGNIPLAFAADRMAVVLRSSRSQRAAWNLVARLSGKEWSATVAAPSQAAGPVRRSQLRNTYWNDGLPRNLVQQYREALTATFARRAFLIKPRLPASRAYLMELDAAIRKCCTEDQDAATTLRDVSKRWQEITERRGVDNQVDAYHRSLGLEP